MPSYKITATCFIRMWQATLTQTSLYLSSTIVYHP